MDVISAISTAAGTGGVAIIRLSGEGALSLASRMFAPDGKTAVADFSPYRMYTGKISGEGFTDYGMCVYFTVTAVWLLRAEYSQKRLVWARVRLKKASSQNALF